MNDLVQSVLEHLRRREAPSPSVLARLGAPDPADAAEGLLRAALLPELAETLEVWLPETLLAADPGRGTTRLADLAVTLRAGGARAPGAAQLATLARLLSTGEVFSEWLRQRPEWATALMGKEADEAKPPHPVWEEIRDAHALGWMRIAARQQQGEPLREVFDELAKLVDGCVAAALECASGETGIAPPGVFAWGRYGAREPGLVCALELLMVDAEPSGGIERERAAECAHLVERLLEELPQGHEAGLTYCIGPVAVSDSLPPDACVQTMRTALGIWRSRASSAQHGPLLSLRQLGGRESIGAEFSQELSKLLERHARHEEDVARPRTRCGDLPDFELVDEDLMAGPCGIGSVERLVRDRQLRSGFRADGGVLDALQTLELEEELSGSEVRRLTGAYSWLRRAEHALGMLGAPSALLPRDSEGQLRVARTMGYAEADATRALARFLYDWRAVRDDVHEAVDRARSALRD